MNNSLLMKMHTKILVYFILLALSLLRQPTEAAISPALICNGVLSINDLGDVRSGGIQPLGVRVAAIVPSDQEGFSSVLLQRTGASWFSWDNIVGSENTPQGDPLWAIAILGDQAARKIGFEIVADNFAVTPSPEYLEGVISRINSKIKQEEDKIPVHFFRQLPSDNLDEINSRRFSDNLDVAIADKGPLYIHDIAFHMFLMFYPPRLLRESQARFQLLFRFRDFLQSRHPNLLHSADVLSILQKSYAFLGQRLDWGGGNLSAITRSSSSFFYTDRFQDSIYGRLLLEKETPRDALINTLQITLPTATIPASEFLRFYLDGDIADKPLGFLQFALQEFIDEESQRDPSFAQPTPQLNHAQQAIEFMKRIRFLRDVILNL